MRIETASESDAPALQAVFNQARRANRSFPDIPIEMPEFIACVDGEQLLVARVEGEIAGFASVWVQDNFLHHLYVLPQFQRQGIGSRLVHACVTRFGLPMSLKCIQSNEAACRFYETRGWRARETADGPEGRYVLYVRDEDV